MIGTILQFVAVLASMIILHEIGHFLACRLFGVEVEEFGFGLPPRITRLFEFRGTEYTLNWIPLGGFVRPKGEKIHVTYYRYPPELVSLFQGLNEKLKSKGINPKIPWLNNKILVFHFK